MKIWLMALSAAMLAAALEAVFYCLEESMGAVKKLGIYGAKCGSEKPKTPTEAPDSLRSVAIAKMLCYPEFGQ